MSQQDSAPSHLGAPRPVLSLWDSVAITVGIVIGAGIFRLPSIVAGSLGSEWWIIAVWIAGGVISLIGALCFAELTTAYPSAGGEYHFLTRAYGPNVGFIFAWARMTVVQTGSIALLSYVFGDYAAQLLPLGDYGPSIYAGLVVIGLTALNVAGLRESKMMQNVLCSLSIIGLMILIVAGLTLTPAEAPVATAASEGISAAGLGTAMILVLLTYGGWNEAAYISAEVKDAKRNMVRALLLSIGIITLLYAAVNFVYIRALGVEGMANSTAMASDLMRSALGPAGAVVITVMICVMVLDSANATVFTGARTNFALGRDFKMFRYLARWDDRVNAPVRALIVQGAIALLLVVLGALDRQGVQTAVDYLSPVFWLFFLMTGASLFVLRAREPNTERPFRVPLYPITPALFCLVSAYMLYSSLSFTGNGALVGVAVLAAGIPFLILARRHAG